MSSDEEYLDDLLKSIMGSEDESEHLSAADSADELRDNNQEEIEEAAPIDLDMLANNLENSDFFGDDFAIEDFDVVEPEPGELEGLEEEEALGTDMAEEDMPSDDLAIDDFAIEDFGVVEPSPEDLIDEEEFSGGEEAADGEEAEGIDDIDSFMNDFAIEEPDVDEMPEENLISPDEVDAMFAAADEAASGSDNEDSIPDISDDDILDLRLMETSDESAGEFSGDDMLAMLERMAEETEESSQTLSGDVIEEEKKEKGKHKKSKKEKKEKGSGLFGRKKKSEDANVVAEGTLEGSVADDTAGETDGQEKKQGFFNKMMAFLTETDDDEQSEAEPGMEPSDENKNILKELDKEDKKKKKKKVKGKKGAQEPELDENGDPIEAEPDKKKEKKEKKKKKKKKQFLRLNLRKDFLRSRAKRFLRRTSVL